MAENRRHRQRRREVDAHGDGRGAGEARGELTVALAAHGHGEIADAAIPERQASTRHIDVHARLADAALDLDRRPRLPRHTGGLHALGIGQRLRDGRQVGVGDVDVESDRRACVARRPLARKIEAGGRRDAGRARVERTAGAAALHAGLEVERQVTVTTNAAARQLGRRDHARARAGAALGPQVDAGVDDTAETQRRRYQRARQPPEIQTGHDDVRGPLPVVCAQIDRDALPVGLKLEAGQREAARQRQAGAPAKRPGRLRVADLQRVDRQRLPVARRARATEVDRQRLGRRDRHVRGHAPAGGARGDRRRSQLLRAQRDRRGANVEVQRVGRAEVGDPGGGLEILRPLVVEAEGREARRHPQRRFRRRAAAFDVEAPVARDRHPFQAEVAGQRARGHGQIGRVDARPPRDPVAVEAAVGGEPDPAHARPDRRLAAPGPEIERPARVRLSTADADRRVGRDAIAGEARRAVNRQVGDVDVRLLPARPTWPMRPT